MRISDWSSDVCSSDLVAAILQNQFGLPADQALLLAQQARQLYPPRVFIASDQRYAIDVETMALFGDASFEVAPGLKLLAGFRYDHERQKVAKDNVFILHTIFPDPADYDATPLLAGLLRQVHGGNSDKRRR